MQKVKFIAMFKLGFFLFFLFSSIALFVGSLFFAEFPLIIVFGVLVALFIFLFFSQYCVIEFDDIYIRCKRLNRIVSVYKWSDIKEVGMTQGTKLFSWMYFSIGKLNIEEIKKLKLKNNSNQAIVCPYAKKIFDEANKRNFKIKRISFE